MKRRRGKRIESLLYQTYLGSLSKGDRWRKSNTTQGGCGQRRKALNQKKDKSINLHILLRRNENQIPTAYPLQEHSRGHDCRRFWRASRSFNDVFLEKALMRSDLVPTRSIPSMERRREIPTRGLARSLPNWEI